MVRQLTLPLSTELARWAAGVNFEDLPEDIVASTKLRVMDVIGLGLAGAETQFGQSVRSAALALSTPGPCRILGFGDRVAVATAAFANGAFSQALEFDDTHNESIVHMSSPAVAAALALAEFTPVSGRDLITAIAIGNEISCRVGCVSSGELHKRGFHPTGLFATFGAAYLAGKLLGLDAEALARTAGIAGSLASGLLECWVDGTQTKFLHPGWSAQSGITAALLARSGITGPAQVFEGRWGLFASHVQDPGAHRDFQRISHRLGEHWESRNSSFKPFPAAHVIHPYISAVLRLREKHGSSRGTSSASSARWPDSSSASFASRPRRSSRRPPIRMGASVCNIAWPKRSIMARSASPLTARPASGIRRSWHWRGGSSIGPIRTIPARAVSRAPPKSSSRTGGSLKRSKNTIGARPRIQ